jgi:hypothetical protein
MSARRVRVAAVALVAAVVVLGGSSCKRSHSAFVAPHYADGADGLKALWSDILDAAKKDDRERVHDLLATTLLSDAEMHRLFGAKADALLPRYKQLMGTLINRGAVELAGNVYEHKYDAVDAFPAEDDKIAAALVEPHPLYAARVRKSTEGRGLRYEGFLYLDGRWKSLNQLGKFIGLLTEPEATSPPTTPPTTTPPTTTPAK